MVRHKRRRIVAVCITVLLGVVDGVCSLQGVDRKARDIIATLFCHIQQADAKTTLTECV